MLVVGSFTARHRGRVALLALALASALVPGDPAVAATSRAKGLDVSNWNGSINWVKVAKAGYRFVFGKATEGTTYDDATYTTNRNGSETAGLVFGAYHFARPAGSSLAAATASAIAQADHFLAVASPQPGELPPVLDLETTGNLPPSRLLAWTVAWLQEVYARTGVEPIVYTSPNFWTARLADSVAAAADGALLWIAHWTSSSQPTVPAQNWDGNGWTFWQWTNCVSVPGVKRCADGDRLNGTNPSSLAIAPYPQGLPVLSTPPTVVGPAVAGRLLAAVPGTWEGGKPVQFSYQWEQCDAAGGNCTTIAGAVGETYTPTSSDVGHALEAVVTATSAADSATAATAPTVAVAAAGTAPSARPASLAPPQILGTAQVGQTLTSSVGTWSGSPQRFAYRWRRCSATGSACVAISHATLDRYTPTPDDIGSTLSLVVTATGAGGSATAAAQPTGVVVAAPLPPASLGTQTAQRGVAGNLETADGRASVTWQPGAVPVGLTVSLTSLDDPRFLPGSGVLLSVPGLPAKGFRWPLELVYAQPQQAGQVLGYSTDGRVYDPLPALQTPALPAGQSAGWFVDPSGLTHVLTRSPLRLALFRRGGWGDPTYTSPTGPALSAAAPLRVLPHPADHTVLVLTRLVTRAQVQLSATVLGRRGTRAAILGRGSRLGARLPAGHGYWVAKTERRRPGSIPVRLRLNGRRLPAGAYRLRLVAVDPWGRRSVLTLPFRYG